MYKKKHQKYIQKKGEKSWDVDGHSPKQFLDDERAMRTAEHQVAVGDEHVRQWVEQGLRGDVFPVDRVQV